MHPAIGSVGIPWDWKVQGPPPLISPEKEVVGWGNGLALWLWLEKPPNLWRLCLEENGGEWPRRLVKGMRVKCYNVGNSSRWWEGGVQECGDEGDFLCHHIPEMLQPSDPRTQKGEERWKDHHWAPPTPTRSVSFPFPQSSLKAKNAQDNPLLLGWQAGNNKKVFQLAMNMLGVCVCVCVCVCPSVCDWMIKRDPQSSWEDKITVSNTLEKWNHLQRIPDIYEVVPKQKGRGTTSEIALALKTDSTRQLKPKLVPCSWYWNFYVVLN